MIYKRRDAICGLLISTASNTSTSLFLKAFERIKHRGPNTSSVWGITEDRTVVKDVNSTTSRSFDFMIGHHRLEVTGDISCIQPFVFDHKALMFNGEIYNYKIIREKLTKLGYLFSTNGDTEVVAISYKHWGYKCFSMFEGMWAIVIIDLKNKSMITSRDPLGVKPLYYSNVGKGFIISSEIKSIIPLTKRSDINVNSIKDYLIYGAQETTCETSFKEIFRIEPGFVQKFSESYNHPKIIKKIINKSFNLKGIYFDDVKRETMKAIISRVPDNFKIFVPLSSGIDSNIIAGVLYKMGVEFESVTCGYTGDPTESELEFVKEVSQKYGFLNHSFRLSYEQLEEHIEKVVYQQDEPFDTMGIFAQNFTYKEISSHGGRVSLDGQGADEMFGGYNTILPPILKELLKGNPFSKNFFNLLNNKSAVKIAVASIMPYYFEKMYFRKHSKQIFNSKQSFFRSFKEGQFLFNDLQTRLKNEQINHLRVLLRYLDRNSMHYSIEAREPFLARGIQEISQNLTNFQVYHNNYNKYILRTANQHVIPSQVLEQRKKNGFSVPQKTWLQSLKNNGFASKAINNSKICRQLSIKKAEDLHADSLWKVFNLALWEQVFFG